MQTSGVKQIGSKAALLDDIFCFFHDVLPPQTPKTLLDVFTGTTRVAQFFRQQGWTVTTSDLAWASEAYAHMFLLRTPESGARIPGLLHTLQQVEPQEGWITQHYCEATSAADDDVVIKMWSKDNGKKADAIRDTIAEWEASGHINHHEAMILVGCLLFALDRVDSSVGIQQAQLKDWSIRSKNPLELKDLSYPVGPVGHHIVGDALQIPQAPAAVAQIDPPYSSHSQATQYHIWDSVTRWDKPAVGLKTNRRIDRVSKHAEFDATMTSPWNSRVKALAATVELVARVPAQHVILSQNDESIIPLDDLVKTLKETQAEVKVKKIPQKRNIMCSIGNAEEKAAPKKENYEALIYLRK